MRTHYRAIAIALALAATTTVYAQSSRTAQGSTGNPIGREDVFYGSMAPSPQTFGRGAFNDTGIGRPNPRNQVQVTPVPEPSQWAMMLAGLALVGFIVRRNARKSHD